MSLLENQSNVDVTVTETSRNIGEGVAPKPEYIRININSNGVDQEFKIKRTTKMRKLMNAYGRQNNLDINGIRFLFDGNRISDEDTVTSLNMEPGDVIEVVSEQDGGGH